MMKWEISAAGGNAAKIMNLPDEMNMLQQAGYRCIDFWLCMYCEKADGEMYRPDWREWVKNVKKLLDDRGISVGQTHCHWRFTETIQEDFSLQAPLQVIHDSFEACHMLGCHRLIFHPVQRFIRMTTEEERQKVLEKNVWWFSQLLPDAEKWGVEIHIENMFDYRAVQKEGDIPLSNTTAEDILYIVKQLNHPKVRICLDTGHANIAGLDVPATVRAFAPYLGSLHMNDNFGKISPIYPDIHLFPCYGKIDWKAVFEALKEVGYEGTLNMEPGNAMSARDPRFAAIQYRTGYEVTKLLRELYLEND